MNLAADFAFAEADENSADLRNEAQILRYVAAINPEATREQFVAAAVAAGYAANSSANRFRESRACSMEMDAAYYDLQKDGRMVEKSVANIALV